MGDIARKCDYPYKQLSNFAGHRFWFDGVLIHSMEGFLQSLKFRNVEMQKHICTLVGFGAKKAGYGKNWHKKQVLYWNGQEYPRKSEAYQNLLNRVYQAMYDQCPSFVKPLKETKGQLTHSIGKKKESETVLTENEMTSRLMKLRDYGFLTQSETL